MKERQHNRKCVIGLAALLSLLLWTGPNVCKLHQSTLFYLRHAAFVPGHIMELSHWTMKQLVCCAWLYRFIGLKMLECCSISNSSMTVSRILLARICNWTDSTMSRVQCKLTLHLMCWLPFFLFPGLVGNQHCGALRYQWFTSVCCLRIKLGTLSSALKAKFEAIPSSSICMCGRAESSMPLPRAVSTSTPLAGPSSS